ncbi:hypothetical protein FACS1894106_3810 [Spirochaetia bacterium]|nr:hypothetical protein FACS1894106_3810 [Spirochaetia bacterium]
MGEHAVDKYNLTEGGILGKLLLVALPIMGSQFMQMAYNLIDMFWLGKVGSDAVASSGAAGMYMWLSFGFMAIGMMGASIGVSQSLGGKDTPAALGFSQNALLIAIVLGLLYGLVMLFFSRELAGFFNFKEANVAADAAAYLKIVALSIPATFVSSVIVGTFNASGNSRPPLYYYCYRPWGQCYPGPGVYSGPGHGGEGRRHRNGYRTVDWLHWFDYRHCMVQGPSF